MATLRLPEPEAWIANAIIGCIRQWKADHERTRPYGWSMTHEDIDHLEKWAEELRQTWLKTSETFDVETYPVQISRSQQFIRQ